TSVFPSKGIVCAGDSLELFAATVAGAAYLWTGPQGYSSTFQNPIIHNLEEKNAGLYEIIITKDGCTSPSASVSISVKSLPVTGAISGPSSVTTLTDATYQVTPSTGSVYHWSVSGGIIKSGDTTNAVLISWGAVGNGTVSVTETNIGGCIGTVKSMNVN